ncbi:hypothetical protein P12x_002686 [Tundrisphaera lichenicola]|uniref:hypothetical protein n=1 Tax=Tundrisphaera lichenicola TaxID=2029860 RepID=UPI003EBD30A5
MTGRAGSRPESAVLLPPAPAQVAPPSSIAPEVASTALIVRGKVATRVSLTFTQPMKPSAVSNVHNYFLYDTSVRSGKLKNALIPLKSAQYQARTATVTLVPARRLDPSGTYLLTNVDITNPLKSEADIQRASARQSSFKSRAGVPLNGLGTGTGSFGELVMRKPAPAGLDRPST